MRIRVYTLVCTLYMPNWAVVYAFSDSTRKAYTATKWGYNWGKMGVPTTWLGYKRSKFIEVDALHDSPAGSNFCNRPRP